MLRAAGRLLPCRLASEDDSIFTLVIRAWTRFQKRTIAIRSAVSFATDTRSTG